MAEVSHGGVKSGKGERGSAGLDIDGYGFGAGWMNFGGFHSYVHMERSFWRLQERQAVWDRPECGGMVFWRRTRDSNPRSLRSTDFKSAAFDRSASPPRTIHILDESASFRHCFPGNSARIPLAVAFLRSPFCSLPKRLKCSVVSQGSRATVFGEGVCGVCCTVL